ncbi:MAG TPA: hypothetical protein VF856_11340, partial [Gemmatimonadaceae bacterium]
RRIVARVRDNNGNLLRVDRVGAGQTVMLTPSGREPWGLRIMHRRLVDPRLQWLRYEKDQPQTDIRGEDALRAAAQLLPTLNAKGASSKQVKDAVALATEHTDPSIVFDRAARLAATKRSWNDFGKGAMLTLVSPELRLALEMVSHEESERRALEGELHLLEEAWKEAEEIAGISDDMFLPGDISKRLTEMKGR